MSEGRGEPRSGAGMRAGRGVESSLDVRRERGDRCERVAPDLVALNAQREFSLQSDDELQRVDRVESESVSKKGHVVRDHLGGQAFEVEFFEQKTLDPLSGRGVVGHNVGSEEGSEQSW